MFLVEDAGVGDECVVDIAVHSAEVVDRVAAVTCAAGCHFADVRFGLKGFCRTEIILYVKSAIISRNLFAPFLSEGCGPATVRQYDDISL